MRNLINCLKCFRVLPIRSNLIRLKVNTSISRSKIAQKICLIHLGFFSPFSCISLHFQQKLKAKFQTRLRLIRCIYNTRVDVSFCRFVCPIRRLRYDKRYLASVPKKDVKNAQKKTNNSLIHSNKKYLFGDNDMKMAFYFKNNVIAEIFVLNY